MNAEQKVVAAKVVAAVLAVLALLYLLVLKPAADEEASTTMQPQTAAQRGRTLAAAQACVACHTLDGQRGVGPSWLGSFGSTRRLRDGSSVVVNEAYLYSAMREPAAQVVDGYENVMLPVALSDAQIADIIALIRELGPATP